MASPDPKDLSVTAGSTSYRTLLDTMHRRSRPRRYLEIGVFHGHTLALVDPSTRAVGIDPNPKIDRPLPRRCVVCEETSDAFFARPEALREIAPIDVAFIDGLHLFEQVLRDFLNVERHMNPRGVVLLHDCLPFDSAIAGRVFPGDGPWTGDVWKIVPILAEYRPDLRVDVAAAAPTGLGIVTGLDPANRVLSEHYEEIVARYMDEPYAPRPATLPGTWAGIKSQFPEFRRRPLGEELGRVVRGARRRVRRLTADR